VTSEEGGSPPALDTLNGDSIDTFIVSLAQTIAWVKSLLPLADPRTTLRNPMTEPKDLGYFSDPSHAVWSAKLHRRPWESEVDRSKFPTLEGGKLLIHFPSEALFEGATESASDGFFGNDDALPWDTWVAYFYEPEDPNYLVSWIPPEAIDLVNKAVAVSSALYFIWMEDFDSPVARNLHRMLYPSGSTATFGIKAPHKRTRR
jgi:hypothetical protein